MTDPVSSGSEHFPELWAKNNRGELVAAPCLSFAVYLDETDAGQVIGFFERAYETLRPNLTHYIAEQMRAPAKITARAEGMVGAWLKRPKIGHEYRIQFWGGQTLDISPWSIQVVLNYVKYDPALLAKLPASLERWEKSTPDGQPELPYTVLRVTVPVDAELAKPGTWIPWVLGFDVLREGRFMFAEAAYSLSIRDESGARNFERAACSRLPGLDWFYPKHGAFLKRSEPSLNAVLYQVKRVAWMTFVSEIAVKVLGGADKIAAALADEPRIILHPVAHGLGIQAGPAPALGDLSRNEMLPLQQRVAGVLRPVRLKGIPLAFEEAFVRHWFNMFDDKSPLPPETDQGTAKA
jgi:hypothetical protein